jgi:PAS domain-containing protein
MNHYRCAKRGETIGHGVIVGIEVDIYEPAPTPLSSLSPMFSIPISPVTRQTFMRRSLVEITITPVFSTTDRKLHIGGMLSLRRVDPPSAVSKSLDPNHTGSNTSGRTIDPGKKNDNGEAHLKLVLDHLPQLIFTARKDGYITFFNSAWFNYTGLVSLNETRSEFKRYRF